MCHLVVVPLPVVLRLPIAWLFLDVAFWENRRYCSSVFLNRTKPGLSGLVTNNLYLLRVLSLFRIVFVILSSSGTTTTWISTTFKEAVSKVMVNDILAKDRPVYTPLISIRGGFQTNLGMKTILLRRPPFFQMFIPYPHYVSLTVVQKMSTLLPEIGLLPGI